MRLTTKVEIRKLYLLEIALIFCGTISLICYFQSTFFSYFFLLFSGTAFLLILVWITAYKRRIGLIFALFAGLTVGLDQFLNSEILKSKVILSATLDDDRSFLHLKLRKNNRFELVSSYMFGEDIFKGRYI